MNIAWLAYIQLALLCGMLVCAFAAGVCLTKWAETR